MMFVAFNDVKTLLLDRCRSNDDLIPGIPFLSFLKLIFLLIRIDSNRMNWNSYQSHIEEIMRRIWRLPDDLLGHRDVLQYSLIAFGTHSFPFFVDCYLLFTCFLGIAIAERVHFWEIGSMEFDRRMAFFSIEALSNSELAAFPEAAYLLNILDDLNLMPSKELRIILLEKKSKRSEILEYIREWENDEDSSGPTLPPSFIQLVKKL